MHIEIYPDEVLMRINTFGGRKHSKKINMNRDLTNEALILEAIGIFTNYWGRFISCINKNINLEFWGTLMTS
ncbi:hypothetical protein [Bacillus cereus]|uniref:hypothetical protein n=1 Tax=Bacillus cereus TaxID=1396 RepID=UPI001F35E541|nr:hypothetical protein [Bacillus cereus]MDA3654151.1 hypothetical protein [Bacillus cereus]WPQ44166.1 hypothetical protein SH594_28525 [Bacillus cereus]